MRKDGMVAQFESEEQAQEAGYTYILNRAERRKMARIEQHKRVAVLLEDRARRKARKRGE